MDNAMTREPGTGTTLVIPAYNEESRIRNLLSTMRGFDGVVIVICDGTDRTAEIVEEFIRNHSDIRLRCLRFPRRLGKGGGLREGFLAADTPFVGFMDADGSASVGEMAALFDKLETVDCAIGSRWVQGAVVPVRQGFLRRFESRVFNVIIRILFGLPYRDTQCGAKAFRRAAVAAILPEVISTGFEFDVELLWRLRMHGFTIGEYPIQWENRANSRVRGADILKMLGGLITIRLKAARHDS
jgi:glycosyltransferase involved in cell wall biosynthesis